MSSRTQTGRMIRMAGLVTALAILSAAPLAHTAPLANKRVEAEATSSSERPNPPMALSTALNRARRAVEAPEKDDVDEAFAHARQLLEVRSDDPASHEARVHFARTLDKWAVLLRSSSAPPEQWAAIEREALSLLDQTLAGASEVDPRLASFAHGYRAGLHLRQPDLASALAENDRALMAAIALRQPDLVVRWSSQRARALSRAGRPKGAIDALRRARSAMRETRESLAADRYLALARTVHLPLADLLLSDSDGLEGPALQGRLLEVQDALEELRVAELTDFFGTACLATRSRSRLVSIPRSVVIYPVVFPDRIEIIAGKDERLHRRTVDIAGLDVLEELHLFRRGLEDPTRSRYRVSAERFYDWLVRPVHDLLAEGADTLVFVPMAEWMGLPVAALWNAESRRFLVEEIAVAITPGLELTDPSPIDLERVESLVVGLTTPVPGFPDLAMVEQEIAHVLATFPGQRLDGAAFTVDTLERSLSEQPFDVLHIASHGVFDERSDQSFLVTSDGRVSLERLGEIIRPSQFRRRRPLKLLVLSACSTAAGSERAAFGLAGVAIQSGAESALASLWRVSDQATTRLISKFYAELSSGRVSRAEALRRAQLELRDDPSFSHPFFWAPFLMINSWL